VTPCRDNLNPTIETMPLDPNASIGTSPTHTPREIVEGAQGAAVADAVAPAAYSAHASGAVTVTSNAATDLDTTAAALAALRAEVAAIVVVVNALIASLETSKVIAS
jgi:hypothetical protein